MKTCKLLLSLTFMIWLASVTPLRADDIIISIIDAPNTTVVYSPVFITVSVTNNSPLSITIPVQFNDDQGWYLQISQANDHLEADHSIIQMDIPVWLFTGQSHFLQKEIGAELTTPGVYEVRAILKSSGKCLLAGVAAKKLGLTPGWQQCWSGSTKSDPVRILVTEAAGEEDKTILSGILAGKYKHNPTNNGHFHNPKLLFSDSYPQLKAAFPNSQYTFAAGMWQAQVTPGRADEILQEMITLQPDNPLSEYAQMILSIHQHARQLPEKEALRKYAEQERNWSLEKRSGS